jgi:TetR/AcrR family transcriptional regulator, cholesterol catabolism regulator
MDIKDRIVKQASFMFFNYGIRSITMDEIAESLGISKRTLYEHFANKEELLKTCIQFKYEENKKLQETFLTDHPDNPLEIIHQHFRHAIITMNTLHPNFFNDLKKYHSGIFKNCIENQQDEGIAFTKSMIEMGIDKGVFRNNADGEILSKMIHSMMQVMTMGDVFPETRFTRSEVVRQVLINFIRGLATPKGLKVIDEKFN